MINIAEKPDLIKVINEELSAGNIIEIKKESHGITIVRIDRKLKYKE